MTVHELLGMTPGDYNMLLFEAGMAYLEANTVADAAARLSRDADFWNWFTASWRGRDAAIAREWEAGTLATGLVVATWSEIHSLAIEVERVPRRIERRACA